MCAATKSAIKTSNAPGAIGPYSQAIKANCGTMIFCSGQIPLDPDSGSIVGNNAAEQTHQVMKNLNAVLDAAGGTFANVVKMGIFVKSLNDFAAVNEVYKSYLTEPFPARATVEVSRLPKDVLVEIDAIAML